MRHRSAILATVSWLALTGPGLAEAPATMLMRQHEEQPAAAPASFLPGMFPGIKVAGGAGATGTYLDIDEDTANQTTYSLTLDLGAAYSGSYVACIVHGQSSSTSTRSISSATIKGETASVVVEGTDPGSPGSPNDVYCGIIIAQVDGGGSSTVSITFNNGMLFCTVSAFRLRGLANAGTADATNSDDEIGLCSFGDAVADVNVTAGSVLIVGWTVSSTGTFTTTGSTQSYSQIADSIWRVYGGVDDITADETPRSVSVCHGFGSFDGFIVAAVFS